jgi:hypothetical protein
LLTDLLRRSVAITSGLKTAGAQMIGFFVSLLKWLWKLLVDYAVLR